MSPRIFLHTLSAPEHIWLDFFREFFQQRHLLRDEATKVPLPNRFFLDRSLDPNQRDFDVSLAHDFDDSRPNALPALVIEDTGAVQTGLTINQMSNHRFSPDTRRDRADQIRFTYIFHCLSRNRGESRLLASMVTYAVTLFRDALLSSGLVKIEPWSVGATQPLRSDSAEDYVDTPVQITFYTMEHWRTLEVGSGDAEGFCIQFSTQERVRFIRGGMTVRDPDASRFINASMTMMNPSASSFVNADMNLAEPGLGERFVGGSLDMREPVSSERFIRGSMRVS